MSERSAPRPPLSRGRLVAFAIVVDAALLLLLEGGARLFFPPPDASRFGEFSRLAIQLGLPSLQKALLPDPALFWRLAPGLPATLVEGRVGPSDRVRFTFSTVPGGFRAPAPAGPPSIVCLGDSCTFGLGVDDAETYPARLAGLTGKSVLNAGVPGFTAFQGRRLFEELLGRFSPEVVLVQFGWNDAAVWDGLSDADHAALLARAPGLLARSRFLQVAASLLPERKADPGAGEAAAGRPRLSPEEFERELRRIIELCRSARALPVLVLWPARYHLDGIRIPAHAGVVRAVAAAERVPLVDLFEVFRDTRGASLYADAIHANAAGNRAAAEAIARMLERQVPDKGEAGPGGATPAHPLN